MATGRVALSVYRALWYAASPLLPLVLKLRAARGKEDNARLAERFGRANLARPSGTLIWIHGASVGECLAALPLISRLLEVEGRNVLVTSGTVTSAQLMAERLPLRAIHQYQPLDAKGTVRRFLGHWQPNLALFVESELWPNIVIETRTASVPLGLINARLSEKSFHRWRRAPAFARQILGSFDFCIAQDALMAERLTALGATRVSISGSLKADAPPLPVDTNDLAAFQRAAGSRPIFLAAQTHQHEEEIILETADLLRAQIPNALTVIVPRHPVRGESIAAFAAARGLKIARRAKGELPGSATDVYIADTLGELGLFYRVVKFAFLGGSIVEHGGHNPLEAAILGVAILTGPHIENFKDIFDAILVAQGRGLIDSPAELAREAALLLADSSAASQLGARACEAAQSLTGALERTLTPIEEILASHARP